MDWDKDTAKVQKKCDDILALIRERDKQGSTGADVSQMNLRVKNEIKGIDNALKKLEKDLSAAEEKRLTTAGELQKREDTLVDLSNFRDRLEQLAEKGSGSSSSNAFTSINMGGDDHLGKSGELMKVQRSMREEQDQHLESLSQVLARQKVLGEMIGDELELQSELLDDLDSGVDRTKSRLSKTNKTLDKVGKSAKSNKGTLIVGALILVIVVIIVALSVTKALLP